MHMISVALFKHFGSWTSLLLYVHVFIRSCSCLGWLLLDSPQFIHILLHQRAVSSLAGEAAQHRMWLFHGFVLSHHLWFVAAQMSFPRVIHPHLCVRSWFILLVCSHWAESFPRFSKSLFMKRLPAMHSHSQDHNQTSQPLQFCQSMTQAIAMCDKWQKCETLVSHCVVCCNWQIIIIFNHKILFTECFFRERESHKPICVTHLFTCDLKNEFWGQVSWWLWPNCMMPEAEDLSWESPLVPARVRWQPKEVTPSHCIGSYVCHLL